MNPLRRRLISIFLLTIGLFQLMYLHLDTRLSGLVSVFALLLLLVVALPTLKLREAVLVLLAASATACGLYFSDSPLQLFERAGLQAAFLTAFMVLLSLLRDGAITSRSVLTLGQYLTSRTPGRRYLAIHLGSQSLGMILNFGALTLLGPLIQRGARSGEDNNMALANWRERRQLSALMRGFSWTVAWSPATVSMAITISVVSGAKILVVCFFGIGAAIGSLVVGWLLDRQTGKIARIALTDTNNLPLENTGSDSFPWASARRLALVCLGLFAITLIAIRLTDSRIVPALMLASPLVTLLWLWVQHRKNKLSLTAFCKTILRISDTSIPAGLPEAITLASAGYIGVIVVALINPDWIAESTGITKIGEPWLYLLAMGIVPLLSNLAMPPILTVTVIGGLYSTLPFDSIDPNLLACALAWGWAINLTASQFGGVPLILSRITGIPGKRLTWSWNGSFSLLIYLWCAVWLTLLSIR